MITDIKDIEDFCPYSDPLFEYVRTVADEFWSDNEGFSDIPDLFARRFSMGCIDDSRKQKYLATTEVLDTIKAFGLDISKFWYLCLFIKDIADTTVANAGGISHTPRKEITDLIEEMDKLLPKPCNVPEKDLMQILEVSSTAELQLKIDGSKVAEIKDLHTIAVIKCALSEFLCKGDYRLLDIAIVDTKANKELRDIHRIRLFDKYLSWYIKDLEADKTVLSFQSNERVSLNKKLLVSRMIFVLGISDDESFFDEFKENGDRLNFLKDYLKSYKNKKCPISNKAYWISV